MKIGRTSTFINHFGKPTCLVCDVYVAVNKDFNIKRHYDTKHTGQARKDKLSRLENTLKQQSSEFQRQTTKSENNILAS